MGYNCKHCWCCTVLGTWSHQLGTDPVTMSSNIFLLKINQLFPNFHTINSITAGMMDDFSLHRQLNILSQGKSSCCHYSTIQGVFVTFIALDRPEPCYCSWDKLKESSALCLSLSVPFWGLPLESASFGSLSELKSCDLQIKKIIKKYQMLNIKKKADISAFSSDAFLLSSWLFLKRPELTFM